MAKLSCTVDCSNCENSFPIVVEIDDRKKDQSAPSSKELTCPFCSTLLSVDIGRPLAGNVLVLKGIPK